MRPLQLALVALSSWSLTAFAQPSPAPVTREQFEELEQKLLILERDLEIGDTDPALKKTVAEQGKQVGAGFNVYLNGHAFKIQTDLFYIFGDDAAQGRVVARLQLDGTS